MCGPIYIHFKEGSGYVPLLGSHWFGPAALPDAYDQPRQPNWRYGRRAPYVSAWDGITVVEPEEWDMTFICQINLADLPANEMLPPAGLLLFFANIEYYDGFNSEGDPVISMHPCEPEHVRVIYVPPMDLGAAREVYAPSAIPLDFNGIKPTIEEPDLQMFGRSDHLEWEDWPEECEGWVMLLQMDSMEGRRYNYNFVDCGVLCFLIDPEALRRLDFSNVRAIILST